MVPCVDARSVLRVRLAALLCLVGVACSERPQPAATSASAARESSADSVALELVATDDAAPPGTDRVPLHTLAFVRADGTRVPIRERAIAYARFRRGVALVDEHRELVLLTPEGARSVLAQRAGGALATGPAGELAYVALHGAVAEVHLLQADGRDRVVASGLSNAGVLAPQPDGSLLFVGARSGGVAGVWLADERGARCLTNCELRTGRPWGDAYRPLPVAAAALKLLGARAVWRAFDGSDQSVEVAPQAEQAGTVPEEPGALQPERGAR